MGGEHRGSRQQGSRLHRLLAHHAAQRFAGPAGAAAIRARHGEPLVRRRYYVSSLVWGCGLLVESLLRIPLVFLLPIDGAVGAWNVLMAVTYTVLISWTIRSGGRPVAAA